MGHSTSTSDRGVGAPHSSTTTYWDISIPLSHHMISWPGDPDVIIHRVLDVTQGDPATVSKIHMGSHTGTHVDAFNHFKPLGLSIDKMDLSPYIGPVYVLEIPDAPAITVEHLEASFQPNPSHGPIRRILFKTKNSRQATPWYTQPFQKDFVHLTPESAQYLVDQQIEMVGIDYLSVDGFHTGANVPVHHIFMDHGVYIVEGLYLGDITPGWYHVVCLPLKIQDGDGAPARVILHPINPTA